MLGETQMQLSAAKHAFITGGASGMGLGMAEALARRGIAVTIADINAQALAAVVGTRAGLHGVVLDVCDRDNWARAKTEAEAKFGPVDILVNNAGAPPDGKKFVELDPAVFDRLVAVDFTGVLNGIQAFAGDMQARGTGHIVNTASMVGLTSGIPGMGPYCAAKAALVSMSESLRVEMAPYGVGVSVLCPGAVATPFTRSEIREGFTASAGRPEVKRIDVSVVADCVLRGIETDEPYIVTHPEHMASIEQRAVAIREAFLRQGAASLGPA
jgi:NAD(P)-dependent dehydrogenase (short-subunit alcohol dehydrogenase family)